MSDQYVERCEYQRTYCVKCGHALKWQEGAAYCEGCTALFYDEETCKAFEAKRLEGTQT